MLAQDLRMKELVNMRPEFDEMLFGSQKFSHRIMLVPVLLIESCLDNLRSTVSPEVLHRMVASIAYEAGVASAVIMADIYEYTTSEDWLRAVSWFGAYFGFAKDEITQVEEDPGQNRFRIRGIWRDSFEADYLLKRDGVSDKPVCGFLTNSTSGAASTIFNREILVKEVQCKAQGHEYCVYEGRTAAEWDDGDPVGEKPISLLSINEYLKVVRDNHERFQAELKKRAVNREKRRTKQGEDGADEGIISRNEKITKFLLMAKKVAPTDTTVLIQGESGTGKEVMARYIHRYSGRLDEPFMAINCAALPANLLESELFGHVKGAFTGADSHKQGLLVKAGGGTILLDEVGELPLNLQPKLLRVIQQKEVRPVGGVESIPVNARLIAATNSDLKEMMTEGGFRNDLYYRLAVFPISLCPLRERQEDIVLLARHFVSKSNSDHPGISPEALRLLNAYSWPGNIRELENCIEFALIMADDKLILPDHLPGFILQNREDSLESLSRDLPTQKELEKRYTQMVLKHTNHNKKEAARILDISIPTLWRRLKE